MSSKIALIWFRLDLRLHDNPALHHAVREGYEIIPVYILDDDNAGEWRMGGASRWWLHHSLKSLNDNTDQSFVFQSGKAEDILPKLIEDTGAQAVFWNRCYEPWRIKRDKHIKDILQSADIVTKSFNASLLWEPWEVLKNDGTPYKVFTPYFRKGCLGQHEPEAATDMPKDIKWGTGHNTGTLDDLRLLPKIPWHHKMEAHWTIGEAGARERLDHFLKDGLNGYKEKRNNPALPHVSKLSPHLHFGEISPRLVWHKAQQHGIAEGLEKDMDHFCSELGWREFSYYLLYHFPQITRDPLQEKFNAFPWDDPAPATLKRWQFGKTGIPIVDAGMRELYETGWMHNRVRMIVGSLLVKNMLIHWHHGEDWFWDCLVDADLASNAASWQWVAGSGADAAPYFRIFNPITQGEKFDPEGTYVRHYVPELANMPKQYIHKPWEAGPLILKEAGVVLGENYPEPIVDLKKSRERALEAFQTIRKTD